MNMQLPFCFSLSVCLLRFSAFAQAPSTNRPAFTPPPNSPEVHADRTVTFRVRAPKASEVSVSGEWPGGAKAMTKGDNDVWSVNVGPLEPDVYGYSFSARPDESRRETDALTDHEHPRSAGQPAARLGNSGRAARHGSSARLPIEGTRLAPSSRLYAAGLRPWQPA
ncbi:MAG: hypothetical protein DME23_22275, partial [Verrucomicrobia bacterium]